MFQNVRPLPEKYIDGGKKKKTIKVHADAYHGQRKEMQKKG
jgi:hypothetical protein